MRQEPRDGTASGLLLTARGLPRAAVLAAPLLGSALLAAALLGGPVTGRLTADNTSWGTGWVTPMPPVEPPAYDALAPGAGVDGGWSGRTWSGGSEDTGPGPAVLPRSPVPPPRPALLRTAGAAGTPTYDPGPPPVPVQRLGPVKHVVRTVATGGTVTLPPGTGFPHVLCSGPSTPGAVYVPDRTTSAGTTVRRYGGSGVFDFYYRDVTTDYRQTAPCS